MSRSDSIIDGGTQAELESLLSIPGIMVWRLARTIENSALKNYASFYGLVPGEDRLQDIVESCAGLEGWACAALPSLPFMHKQSDRYAGVGKSKRGSSLSLTLPHSNIPDTIKSFAGLNFCTMLTAGDRACAIYSVFGRMRSGTLFFEDASHFLRNRLGATADECR